MQFSHGLDGEGEAIAVFRVIPQIGMCCGGLVEGHEGVDEGVAEAGVFAGLDLLLGDLEHLVEAVQGHEILGIDPRVEDQGRAGSERLFDAGLVVG